MKSSSLIKQAREDYYSKHKNKGNLNFGIDGILAAGSHPVQQFVGSFSYTITEQGNNLKYTLYNKTSRWSFFLHIHGIVNTDYGQMRNTYQFYIFTEPKRK